MSNHPNRSKKPVTPTYEVTSHRVAQIAAAFDRVGKDLAKLAELFPLGWVQGREETIRMSENHAALARVYWNMTALLKHREAKAAQNAAPEESP